MKALKNSSFISDSAIVTTYFYFWVTGKFPCLYAEDNARETAPCTACRLLLVPRCAAGLFPSPSIFQSGHSKTACSILDKIDAFLVQITVIRHCLVWNMLENGSRSRAGWRGDSLGQLRLVESGAAVCAESSHFLVQWHPPPPAEPTIRLYLFNHVIFWLTTPSGLIIMT